MADGIRIEVLDDAVTAALERLAEADRSKANDAIGAAIVASTQRRMERQTAPDGKAWARLSPRTAAKRVSGRRRGYDNMLRVSNRLFSSLSHASDATSATVGTNLPYAAVQQLGGEIQQAARTQKIYQNYNPKTGDISRFVKRSRANLEREVNVGAHTIKIPARPFLGLDADDRAEITAIYADFYRDVAEGTGP